MRKRKRIYISRDQKEESIKELIQTNCNIKLNLTVINNQAA